MNAQTASGTCGGGLSWNYDSGTRTLTITYDGVGTGVMDDVVYEQDVPWDAYRRQIDHVVLPEGMTNLGNYACAHFNITSVSIPSTVTRIGTHCFLGCWYIPSITLPSNLQAIGDEAFSICRALTSITIPATVTNIGYGITSACKIMETIEVAAGNTVYESPTGSNAIVTIAAPVKLVAGCKTTVIPNNVAVIGKEAMSGQNYLPAITLPNSVTTIEQFGFDYCFSAPTLHIPANVSSIAVDAFQGCEFTSITVDANNTTFDSRNNCNAIIKKGANPQLVLGCVNTVIPSDVTSIGNNAFATLEGLTSITIPAGVTEIGGRAFASCSGLTEMTCLAVTPPAPAQWSSSRFYDVTNTIPVYVPAASLTAYQTTSPWSYFTNFQPIGGEEPVNCAPYSGSCNDYVTWSLDTCSGLLLISGTDTMPNYSAFDAAPWYVYNKYITSIEVAEGITYVGDYSFYQLGHVKTAKLPTTLLKIRNRAFASCISLEKVELQSIPNYLHTLAFDVCNKLDTIFCPCDESYTGIDSYELQPFYNKLYRKCDKKHPAFYGYCGAPRANTNLAWRFEDGLFTFTSSGAMADFLLGEEDYILWGDLNSFADSIVLPEGLTVIGANAFMGCENVHSVVIPSSVISINEDAFNGCFGMDTVFMSTPAADLTWDDDYTGDFPDFKENKATICWLPTAEMKAAYEAKFASVNVTFAGPEEEEPECTIASGALTETLNWALTCDNVLKLTGSGPMPDFKYPNYGPWNSLRHKVHALDLPAGLTTIGKYAFYQMDSLNTAVIVPEGVTSIGYCAFSGEGQLPAITLPSTLQTMDGGVFSENWALQSLTIPASVRSIGSRLTEGCTSLTSIVVDANNMVFDSRENCNAVIQTATNKLVAGCSVTVIPNTVVTIGTQAFSSLRNMTQIRIPNSVTSLEELCFQYCSGLTDLVIPSSLVDIDGSAFAGCKFNTLSVNPGNPRYDSRDNCNAIIETTTNVLIKGCNTTVIPDEIEVIGEGAFWSCWNLKFINLPETVDSIAHYGLIYCNRLQSITCFAVNPPHVGPQAFNYGTEASININPAIPVYVPGPSLAAYQAAPGWNYFTNFVALDSYYTVKALANHGQVTGTGTYAANTTVTLVATPDEGFVFSKWSDGSTNSTRNLVVTCDTTVRAFFEVEQQEEQTIIAGQSTVAEVSEITITFEPIVDAVLYELKVYMHGRLVATVHINALGQIVGDIVWAAPSRIQATTVDADPSVYQVNLSNLEFGQDYTFTLDSYNEDEECISAQNGSFNVPEQETPTDCRDIQGAESVTTRKIMENGRLLIIVRDQRFDAQGQIVE